MMLQILERDPVPPRQLQLWQAVRAAFARANHRKIDFAGSSLTFQSVLPVPYPAINPTAIPIQNLSDVTIDLRGTRSNRSLLRMPNGPQPFACGHSLATLSLFMGRCCRG